MKKGVIFVIFGATGDLSKRKLIPAIYQLLRHNRLSDFHVLGLARSNLSAKSLIARSKPFIDKPSKAVLDKIVQNTTYLKADFTNPNDYISIKNKIAEIEGRGVHNKVFYLATGSNNFESISKNMVATKIADQKNCKTRVVYEKPFGRDLRSARVLNNHLKRIFTEDQMYRIDHYLGKELVESVSILRFTNQLFEPIWSNKHVESIEILLDEDIGISERGPYYDTYGAVRDMVQNHALQLLALLTMEMPPSLSGECVRDKKAELLRSVKITDSLLGQYAGYTREKGISAASRTETFAALKLQIANTRWRGVPIFIRTGKFLDKKESTINVRFRNVGCSLGSQCDAKQNLLQIRINPNQGMSITLNTKAPGIDAVAPVKFDFCYACEFGPNTPKGYENLFADIINGDQTVFTRIDELLHAWRVVDKVKRNKVYSYRKGSTGPKELASFMERVGWKK